MSIINNLRAAAVAGLLIAAPLAVGAAGAQSPLPDCGPPSQQDLSLEAPVYVRSGQLLTIEYTGYDPDADTAPMVTVSFNGAANSYPQQADTYSGRFGAPTPAGTGRLKVTVSYQQGAGSPLACAAHQSFDVDLFSKQTKLGDTDIVRLAGSYRVHFSPQNYSGKSDKKTWRFTPSCEAYGCSTSWRSSSRARGTFRINGDVYRRVTRPSKLTGTCVLSQGGRQLRSIPNAFRETIRTSLSAYRERNGVATRIRGLIHDVFSPTPGARAKGCVKTTDYIDHFTGSRTP